MYSSALTLLYRTSHLLETMLLDDSLAQVTTVTTKFPGYLLRSSLHRDGSLEKDS
jgi:hypothetical protein